MLPLNNIKLPAIAVMVASTMISICEFDFIPPELTTDKIFIYDEELNQKLLGRFDWLVTK